MALGADRPGVIRMFLMEGIGLAAAGLGSGIVAAAAITNVLASLLYGVTPGDPSTFVCASLLLLAGAAIATIVPAWRASRLDPMIALRQD
jgi:ABC-type antimicrobial peptide transport system permease subunit